MRSTDPEGISLMRLALVNGARDGGPLAGWRRAVIGERLLQAL